jgi:hypothetical protein
VARGRSAEGTSGGDFVSNTWWAPGDGRGPQ